MNTDRVDTKTLNSTVNLVDLAGRYTKLHKESGSEMAGPCPKCGGDDRFHVAADWFFCRQCHDKRGDAIEFVCWLRGCDFKEAVNLLSNGTLVDAPSHRRSPERSHVERDGLPMWAASRLATAQERLMTGKAGEVARSYLQGRGLTPDTWRTFGLGFDAAVSVPGTEGKRKAPAIAIPWYDPSGALVGVRYRFLKEQNGRKSTATKGSIFAGYGWGTHMATPSKLATLTICEGEINAMSIYQVAGHTRVDVLSLGSESAHIPDDLIAMGREYGAVIAWLDKPEHARRIAGDFPGALAKKSANGFDANDRLQRGELGGMICAARLRLCQSPARRLELLWNLYDGGQVSPGLDDGTAAFVRELARELGQTVTLRNVGGAWFTGRV